MKRGVAALLVIIIVLLLTGVQFLYITSRAELYVKMLNNAEEKIEHNDLPAAQEEIQKLDHRYVGSERILEIFLPHSDVNEVSVNLAMLRRYAQTGSIEEYMALSAATKRMLLTMSEAQQPHFHNIL